MNLRIACLLALVPLPAFAETLSLDQYKNQVAGQNLSYEAGILQLKGFEGRMAEAGLDFMPSLTGNLTYTDDRRIQLIPQLYGNDQITESAGLGVTTKLRTGTLVNFGYNWGYQTVFGSTFPATVGPYTGAPALTLTQPLWRDFGAALSKANEEATLASYRAQTLTQLYANELILFNAETAYWRLALTQQLVKFDEDAISRSQKILKWSQKRVSMNVADRTDELQSEASVKQRQFQYQTDLEQLREAASQFNSLRNVKGDEVVEEVTAIDPGIDATIVKKIRKIFQRFDTQAAVENAKNQQAMARSKKEGVKPSINIFGTVQFNGRGNDVGGATGTSWNSDNPTYSAGLNLSIPLDGGTVNRINQGYNAAAMAADLIAKRAAFDLDQDWNDLQKKMKDAIARLSMARDLEKLQEIKLQHERVRFSTGRTTNFQVLQFEDNFSDAQTSRLRIQNEIITDYAQALLFNGGH